MTLHVEGIEPLHYLLAYAGMIIHILMKLAKVFNLPDFSARLFFKRNFIPFLISMIGIPVLLIVATDATVKEFLPINNVTAVLAGWQTQSLFKSVFALASKKRGLSAEDETASDDENVTPPNDNSDKG